jgi:hypothetical protein
VGSTWVAETSLSTGTIQPGIEPAWDKVVCAGSWLKHGAEPKASQKQQIETMKNLARIALIRLQGA